MAAGSLRGVVAPNFGFEVRNALLRAARRGRISWANVASAASAVDRLHLAVPSMPLPDADVMETCRRYGLGWGDARHVLVAARLQAP